jgi:hypothetical protein
MTTRARLLTLPIVLLVFLAIAAPSWAGMRFEFTLDGAAAGTPSSAFGTAVLVLNDAMTEVTYDIRHSNLEGGETGTHFHDGTPGNPGARLFNLPVGETKQGVWPLEDNDLDILVAGNVFVMVHSSLFPIGEIRGDATLQSVPVQNTTWSGVKALYR